MGHQLSKHSSHSWGWQFHKQIASWPFPSTRWKWCKLLLLFVQVIPYSNVCWTTVTVGFLSLLQPLAYFTTCASNHFTMLSEKTFVRLLDLNPLISLKLRKNRKMLKYLRLIVVLFMSTSLFISLRAVLQIRLVDIPSFMHKINMIYYVVSCVFNLWLLKRCHSFSIDFPNFLGELDLSIDVSLSSQLDIFLFTLFTLLVLHVLSILWFVGEMSHFNPVSDLLSVTYIVQLAALKHMLSKRLGVLVNRTAGSEDWTETLDLSRRITSLNEKVNASFSLLVLDALTGGLLHLLFSAVAFWRVYGLHHLYDCYELRAPIVTMFNHGYFIVTLVSISWPSTKLSESVSLRVIPSLIPSLSFYLSLFSHPSLKI